MKERTFKENLKAGFGLFGSPEELENCLSLMNNEKILRELKKINGRKSVLGSGNLCSEYYHELADTPERAVVMMDMDDRYAALIRQEASRRGLV